MESGFYTGILLPLSLGFLMFGMGLSLHIYDFKRVLVRPRALFIGLFCQMILLPVIAFLIATLANLPPEIKVGIVIIAACPGGATSNLITYLLRGNVALSISMTSVNSFLTLFSVPFLIYWALVFFMGEGMTIHLPIWDTVRNIFVITIIPTSLGVLIRYRWPESAKAIEKPGRYILTILYAIIFIVAVIVSSRHSAEGVTMLYLKVAPFTLFLNLLGMITGYAFAKLLRYGTGTQITLAVEVGIQNSALAITIASSFLFLNNPRMAIPAVVYGLFTFASAVIFGMIIKRRAARQRSL